MKKGGIDRQAKPPPRTLEQTLDRATSTQGYCVGECAREQKEKGYVPTTHTLGPAASPPLGDDVCGDSQGDKDGRLWKESRADVW